MVLAKARRPEDRDALLLEFEAFEAVQELEEEPDGAFEVGGAIAPARQEKLLGACDLLQQ